jgi:hypothetical protein
MAKYAAIPRYALIHQRHCEPTGRREAPPDDRLREAIQLYCGKAGLLRRIRLRPKAGFGGQERSSQ